MSTQLHGLGPDINSPATPGDHRGRFSETRPSDTTPTLVRPYMGLLTEFLRLNKQNTSKHHDIATLIRNCVVVMMPVWRPRRPILDPS